MAKRTSRGVDHTLGLVRPADTTASAPHLVHPSATDHDLEVEDVHGTHDDDEKLTSSTGLLDRPGRPHTYPFMALTLGGQYVLEEQIGFGGCGPSPFSPTKILDFKTK
jgi:hypothetical protein